MCQTEDLSLKKCAGDKSASHHSRVRLKILADFYKSSMCELCGRPLLVHGGLGTPSQNLQSCCKLSGNIGSFHGA